MFIPFQRFDFRRTGGASGGAGRSGFTLIELLVVMTVIALVLAAGLPNLSAWMQAIQIRTAAESIQNGLQAARAEAVKRNANIQFVLTSVAGGGQLSNWGVSCVTPVADADGDGQAECPGAGTSPATIQAYGSQEGSRNAVISTGQSTIVFNSAGRLTPTPASVINITVENPTGGTCVAASGPMRCLRIAVSQTGQIRMCDPSLASTDPRGC